MHQLRHWEVFTPQYETYYSYDAMEPSEYGADAVCVEAFTRREALILGRKKLEKEFPNGYISDNRSDGVNPFSGLKVKLSLCDHKVLHYCWGNKDFILPCEEKCIECDRDSIRETIDFVESYKEQFKKDWGQYYVQIGQDTPNN
jgi:hypothetical protein